MAHLPYERDANQCDDDHEPHRHERLRPVAIEDGCRHEREQPEGARRVAEQREEHLARVEHEAPHGRLWGGGGVGGLGLGGSGGWGAFFWGGGSRGLGGFWGGWAPVFGGFIVLNVFSICIFE